MGTKSFDNTAENWLESHLVF